MSILNKSTVKNLDDAAKELVKDKTMYRYLNETSYNFEKLRKNGIIDVSPSQFPGYVTLDRIDDVIQAKSILQLPKEPTWVAEFSNSQIVNDIRFPKAKFNDAQYEIHIFDAVNVEGAGGNTYLRITYIEYRMLNNFADKLGAVKGNIYPDFIGELKIVSEIPYCNFCQGRIQQFNKRFPNVKLILVDGTK